MVPAAKENLEADTGRSSPDSRPGLLHMTLWDFPDKLKICQSAMASVLEPWPSPLFDFHAQDNSGVGAVPVFRRHPVGVNRRITQSLFIVGVPAVVTRVVDVHLEGVERRIRGRDDVHHHGRLVVALHVHGPVELGFTRFTTAGALTVVAQFRCVTFPLVHLDGVHRALVVAVAVVRLHPVLVLDVGLVQGLLVREHVGALAALGLHLELVVVSIVGVRDEQRGVRLVIRAHHNRHPNELRLVRRAVLRRDAQEADSQLSLPVDVHFVFFALAAHALVAVVLVDRVIGPRIFIAVHITLTVVPAVLLQVGVSRERLRLDGLAVLVERHVQVGPGVVTAGRADRIAGVAHRAHGVGIVQQIALGNPELVQVAVAADVAVAVVHHHRVAVPVVAVPFGRDFHHDAVRHGRDRLAVRFAPVLGEVQRIVVVAVVEAVVHVRTLGVGLGQDPVLTRLEGQLQEGITPPDAVLAGILTASGQEDRQNGHGLARHHSPLLCGWVERKNQIKY